MRTLHVEAQYLFMCNNSNMIYDVYIKDEADKEIERLRKIIDFWKATVYVELEEQYTDDEADKEMYKHETALQQYLKKE